VEKALEEKFSFTKITAPEQLQEAYRLRFQVYGRECNFIKESDYPLGLETDEYDRFSVHFAGLDSQGRMVGAVRLILPSSPQFPIEEHCPRLDFDRNLISRQNCAEVSRLTISKLYRRRAQDGLYYEPQVEDKKVEARGNSFMRRMRPMAFGLYRAMYQESKRKGIRYWFALMEKSLTKLLHIHGLVFHPIGPEVDFLGLVKPYIGDLRDLEKNVFSKFPQFFEYFTAGLDPELKPKFSVEE
jgi:N-acyl amino acid synthase of PEP-CTERM/exosortase system